MYPGSAPDCFEATGAGTAGSCSPSPPASSRLSSTNRGTGAGAGVGETGGGGPSRDSVVPAAAVSGGLAGRPSGTGVWTRRSASVRRTSSSVCSWGSGSRTYSVTTSSIGSAWAFFGAARARGGRRGDRLDDRGRLGSDGLEGTDRERLVAGAVALAEQGPERLPARPPAWRTGRRGCAASGCGSGPAPAPACSRRWPGRGIRPRRSPGQRPGRRRSPWGCRRRGPTRHPAGGATAGRGGRWRNTRRTARRRARTPLRPGPLRRRL